MLFSMDIRRLDGGLDIAELSGRLTIGKAVTDVEDRLKELVDQRPAGLIVDLAALDLIDSAGVGALINIIGMAKQEGVPLRVAGCKDRVRHVFDLTQVTQLVEMLPDVQAAIASFGQASGV